MDDMDNEMLECLKYTYNCLIEGKMNYSMEKAIASYIFQGLRTTLIHKKDIEEFCYKQVELINKELEQRDEYQRRMK